MLTARRCRHRAKRDAPSFPPRPTASYGASARGRGTGQGPAEPRVAGFAQPPRQPAQRFVREDVVGGLRPGRQAPQQFQAAGLDGAVQPGDVGRGRDALPRSSSCGASSARAARGRIAAASPVAAHHTSVTFRQDASQGPRQAGQPLRRRARDVGVGGAEGVPVDGVRGDTGEAGRRCRVAGFAGHHPAQQARGEGGAGGLGEQDRVVEVLALGAALGGGVGLEPQQLPGEGEFAARGEQYGRGVRRRRVAPRSGRAPRGAVRRGRSPGSPRPGAFRPRARGRRGARRACRTPA